MIVPMVPPRDFLTGELAPILAVLARGRNSQSAILLRHSGAREARTRSLEIPGSMPSHRPGMTVPLIEKPPFGGLPYSCMSCSNATSVRVGPDLLLGEVHQAGKDDQEDEHLQAQALAFLHMRLGGPHQEGRNVVGILLHGRGRAVVEGHLTVRERLRHLDGVPREVLVV